MTTQQPEALRMALDLEALDIDGIATELRRQHARIAELEAQLEAIGAGGVSGPLMGQPQAPLGGRWYMVTHDGAATLCIDQEDAQAEAVKADRNWPHMGPHRAVQLVEVGASAKELHPSPPEGMVAEQALRKVLSVVQRYLPPDGPTVHDAMSEIIAIVDPWPLGPLEKP